MESLPLSQPSQVAMSKEALPPAQIPQVPAGRWPSNQVQRQDTDWLDKAVRAVNVHSDEHKSRCNTEADQPLSANRVWDQGSVWMQLENYQRMMEKFIIESHAGMKALLCSSQQNICNEVIKCLQMQQMNFLEQVQQYMQKMEKDQLPVCLACQESLRLIDDLQNRLNLQPKQQLMSCQRNDGDNMQSQMGSIQTKAISTSCCDQETSYQIQQIPLLEHHVATAQHYAAEASRTVDFTSSLAMDLPEPPPHPFPPPPPLLVVAPHTQVGSTDQGPCSENFKTLCVQNVTACPICGGYLNECSCCLPPSSLVGSGKSAPPGCPHADIQTDTCPTKRKSLGCNSADWCQSDMPSMLDQFGKTECKTVQEHINTSSGVAAVRKLELQGIAEPCVDANANSWVDYSLMHGSPLGKLGMFASMLLIMSHTIFIGVEMDINIKLAKRGAKSSKTCEVIDQVFVVLFVIELTIRILVHKKDFVRGSEGNWNMFDTVLVCVSLFDAFFSKAEYVSTSFFRFMRLVRFVRAARILRVLRCIRALRLMVASIICSLVYLLWTLVLLVVVLYAFSILMLQGVQQDMKKDGTQDPDLINMYGSVAQSMMTLFMAITGGIDWGDALKPLKPLGWGYDVVMVVYISFLVFGLLNVLTAVFVESAGNISNIDKELAIQQQMINQASMVKNIAGVLSKALDEGSSTISIERLENLLKSEEIQAHLQIFEVGASQAKRLFHLLDIHGSGHVEMEDFVIEIVKLKQSAKGVDIATVRFESRRVLSYLTAFMKYVEDRLENLNNLNAGKAPRRISQVKTLEEFVSQYDSNSIEAF